MFTTSLATVKPMNVNLVEEWIKFANVSAKSAIVKPYVLQSSEKEQILLEIFRGGLKIMRNIKFRGKDSEWHFGNLNQDDYTIYRHDDVYPVIPETVGQFTGFIDIDSTEIYEGDILQAVHQEDIIGLVIFRDGCFVLKYHYPEYNELMPLHMAFKLYPQRVIGNVFDNPELLEVQKNEH